METEPKTIKCYMCKTTKDSNEFSIKTIGIRNKGCKECLKTKKLKREKYILNNVKNKSIFAELETEPQTIECYSCKKIKDCEEFSVKSSGIRNKGCKKCLKRVMDINKKRRCDHGKQKSRCSECKQKIIKNSETDDLSTSDNDKCDVVLNEEEEKLIRVWFKKANIEDEQKCILSKPKRITLPFLKILMKENEFCYYCRDKVECNEYWDGYTAKLERLDKSKGYVKSNCVIACNECNYSLSPDYKSDIEMEKARRKRCIHNIITINCTKCVNVWQGKLNEMWREFIGPNGCFFCGGEKPCERCERLENPQLYNIPGLRD